MCKVRGWGKKCNERKKSTSDGKQYDDAINLETKF